MTEQIGTHGLSCVSDTDYAAFALAMQCNALAVEDALVTVSNPIETAVTRPWVYVTNTDPIVVDDSSGSGFAGPLGLTGELFPSPGAINYSVQASGIPVPYGMLEGNFLPRGIYLIGTTVSWTLGATTANSLRQLMVYGIPEENGIVNQQDFTDLFRNHDYQGDGGASGALMTAGILDARNGDIAVVEAFFMHTNTASDLTIATGAWKLWAVHLGEGVNL